MMFDARNLDNEMTICYKEIMIELPDKIFITGAPGSKWTSVTHLLETHPLANITDRNPNRHYDHNVFQGHHGSYFALPFRKYEFDVSVEDSYINTAFDDQYSPGKFVKGHDWAYMLDELKEKSKGNWLLMVMRPDTDCFAWWNNHGGFVTKYPSYETYEGNIKMMSEIMILNDKYSKFAQKHDQRWEYFSPRWIKENFGHTLTEENMSILNNKTNLNNFSTFFDKCMVCLVKL